MLLEMHSHTAEHSLCSHAPAAELLQKNFDKGLQGTVLTDHHYLWSPEEIRNLRSLLKVDDYYLILAGQEVDTPEFGHVLVYGADRTIERGTPLEVIRRRFPNAALVWAHPYRDQNIPSPDMLLHLLIDGVEVFNSNHTVAENNRGVRDWHRYRFTALSGTDTHAVSYAGLYPTIFDHPFTGIEEMAGEIRAGRCRPYFKEMPRAGTSHTHITEVTIGTGKGKPREKYIMRTYDDAESWRESLRSTRVIDELRRNGFDSGPYRVPQQFGKDEKNLIVIEQGIQGKSLFDALAESSRDEARGYLRLAAEWLARMHNKRLQITPPDRFWHEEPGMLEFYLTAFYGMKHPQTRRAQEIMDTVIELETRLYCHRPERMIQGHGDFHPRNIFIGRDRTGPKTSTFIAAIDFSYSFAMPPAFDVGTFLAQFMNQFHGNREVLSKVSPELFLETYLQQRSEPESDFLAQVELFKARTALSICYYLIRVGLGGSENLWRVLVEAGQGLTHLQVKSIGMGIEIEQTGKERRSA